VKRRLKATGDRLKGALSLQKSYSVI
jgi:hypothetical protein